MEVRQKVGLKASNHNVAIPPGTYHVPYPTPDPNQNSELIQSVLDEAEANGGGTVLLPPGLWLLNASPLIPSNVLLRGTGPATVLRGCRPPSARGHALVYNKGYDRPRYDGAQNFGISHVAVDSPESNGITFVHASNVTVSHIYGIDAYHHLIDIGASKHVFCHDLFLTGESGTATLQIDALPSTGGASKGWSGSETLNPAYDDTGCDTFYLTRAIITAKVRDPKKNWAIHFHKVRGRNIFIRDVTVGNTEVGIYQDASSYWDGIYLDNVNSENVGYGVWLRSTHEQSDFRMTNCSFTGLTLKGLSLANRTDVRISDTVFRGDMARDGLGLRLRNCAGVLLERVTVEETGKKRAASAAISLEAVDGAVVSNSIMKNFSTGLRATAHWGTPSRNVMYSGLLGLSVDQVAEGSFVGWVSS